MRNFYADEETLEKYMSVGANIMLVGRHGIGKTTIVKNAAKALGYKVAILNGATTDPYVDIVGIPVASGDNNDPVESRELQMIQKKNLMEAEVVFIDEYSRSPRPTLNAIMEMIEDRSINGRPLPNLKTVVAAMNPPQHGSDSYMVEEVDPAQLDRFHVTMTMTDRADADIIARCIKGTAGLDEKVTRDVARVFADWQNSLLFDSGNKERAPYMSPRRIEKMARMFCNFPTFETLYHSAGNAEDAELLNLQSLFRTLTKDTGIRDVADIGKSEKPSVERTVAHILTHKTDDNSMRSALGKVMLNDEFDASEFSTSKLVDALEDDGCGDIIATVKDLLGFVVNPDPDDNQVKIKASSRLWMALTGTISNLEAEAKSS